MTSNRRPFRNLTREAWQNLAIATVVFMYVAQVVLDLAWGNLFGNLGVDFAAFWSAGHIVNEYGYASAYDLEQLAQIQQQLVPARAAALGASRILPTAYLPVFLVPFQVMALLPPAVAAGAWITLNLVASVAYLAFFARRFTSRRIASRQLLMFMVSVPVFLNLFVGQANVWLMICVGEFLLAREAGKSVISGAWLAGLLLKPQSLILIVPAVLLQRWTKTALGMLLAGAAILGASWLLAGTNALMRLGGLWFDYLGGPTTADIQLMMNWRMIGMHAEDLIGPGFASAVTIAGMALTVAAALAMWMRTHGGDHTRILIAFLGLLAATTLVAWHAHVHMAMILIPPLLMLVLRQHDRSGRMVDLWILFPAALYAIRNLLASMLRADILPDQAYGLVDSLVGIGLLSVNLVLLAWALHELKPWEAGTYRRDSNARRSDPDAA